MSGTLGPIPDSSQLTQAAQSTSLNDKSFQTAALQALVLKGAIPWIREFKDQIVTIKVGGSTLEPENESDVKCMAHDIAALSTLSVRPVVTLGGGKRIKRALEQQGYTSNVVNNLRVSPAEHLPIIQNVLEDEVCGLFVRSINESGASAITIPGSDVFTARYIDFDTYHYVGEITHVNTQPVRRALENGFVPVVSSLGRTESGHIVNINADQTASALAIALQSKRFIAVSDMAVRSDINDPESRISQLTPSQINALLEDGTIDSGMMVKVQHLCDVVNSKKVEAASIVASGDDHRIMLELLTEDGIGTQIVADS